MPVLPHYGNVPGTVADAVQAVVPAAPQQRTIDDYWKITASY